MTHDDRPEYRRPPRPVLPARSTHGKLWWWTLGWWWAPLYWFIRVVMWLVFLPAGIWWSILHGRAKREQRIRRGYEQAERAELREQRRRR